MRIRELHVANLPNLAILYINKHKLIELFNRMEYGISKALLLSYIKEYGFSWLLLVF